MNRKLLPIKTTLLKGHFMHIIASLRPFFEVKEGKMKNMHFLIQMWIEQYIPTYQIDYIIDLYDKTSNKYIAIVKKTNDTYIVLSYDSENIKEINP
jgi:hypothetical protein